MAMSHYKETLNQATDISQVLAISNTTFRHVVINIATVLNIFTTPDQYESMLNLTWQATLELARDQVRQ